MTKKPIRRVRAEATAAQWPSGILLNKSQVSEAAGVTRKTADRLMKSYPDRVAHNGAARSARRYPVSAIEQLAALAAEDQEKPRGSDGRLIAREAPTAGERALARQIRDLRKDLAALARHLGYHSKRLEKMEGE